MRTCSGRSWPPIASCNILPRRTYGATRCPVLEVSATTLGSHIRDRSDGIVRVAFMLKQLLIGPLRAVVLQSLALFSVFCFLFSVDGRRVHACPRWCSEPI